jgi:hypothetical protein
MIQCKDSIGNHQMMKCDITMCLDHPFSLLNILQKPRLESLEPRYPCEESEVLHERLD